MTARASTDIEERRTADRVRPALRGDDLSPDEIRAELDRIVGSGQFPASQRRRNFLRYVVDEALGGRADRVKAYTIATDVFGRDETFDPQADPVVRLEARQLRRDLDSYYVSAGAHDPVRISIPKGSYVPHFERHVLPAPPPAPAAGPATTEAPPAGEDAPPVPSPRPRAIAGLRWPAAAALAVALVLVAASAWLLTDLTASPQPPTEGRPAVVVLPIRGVGPDTVADDLAAGIGQELVNSLMSFPAFRVYLPPEGGAQADAVLAAAREAGVAYAVSGNIAADDAGIRLAMTVTDAATGEVQWAKSFTREARPQLLAAVPHDLAGEIATVLGQPYGVVNRAVEVHAGSPEVANMDSYVCVLKAYGYRRTFSREAYGPVLACLEKALERDPDYADALAMLGWLYLDGGRFGPVDDAGRAELYAKALAAAERAVTLAPENTLALKALSSVEHYLGRYEDSERHARRAADLNPYDPDTLAQLGWRLAARGNFAEGVPILEQAIARSVNPPGWYHHLVAVDLCLREDYGRMLETAERAAVDGSQFSRVLIAIAAGGLGDERRAREALASLPETGIRHDFTAYLHLHGATDTIVAALTTGLARAESLAAE